MVPSPITFLDKVATRMCGRFTLKTPVADWLADLFPDWDKAGVEMPMAKLPTQVTEPRYNIAPSQPVVVARIDEQGRLDLTPMRWGLVPPWADSLSVGYKMINARSESLTEKPSFRPALIDKRCVILADGYYEWRTLDSKTKQPYWIHRTGESLFAMAGLWARNHKVHAPENPDLPTVSATIITTASNEDTQSVHDRMPAVFCRPGEIKNWLDPQWNRKECADEIVKQLKPSNKGTFELRPVSTSVNSPMHQGPSLIEIIHTEVQSKD